MAFHIAANAPNGSLEAVTRYFSDPSSRAFLQGIELSDLGASDAYPIHVATLEDLLSGNLPGVPDHWRHLLVQGDTAAAEADLADDEVRVVAVYRGPRAAGTVRALDQAALLERDYEMRMLEAPSIHLVAVWLHADGDDSLIPVEPDDTGLPLYQPIALPDALLRLREIASAVQQDAIDNPGPSGT